MKRHIFFQDVLPLKLLKHMKDNFSGKIQWIPCLWLYMPLFLTNTLPDTNNIDIEQPDWLTWTFKHICFWKIFAKELPCFWPYIPHCLTHHHPQIPHHNNYQLNRLTWTLKHHFSEKSSGWFPCFSHIFPIVRHICLLRQLIKIISNPVD